MSDRVKAYVSDCGTYSDEGILQPCSKCCSKIFIEVILFIGPGWARLHWQQSMRDALLLSREISSLLSFITSSIDHVKYLFMCQFFAGLIKV